MISEVKRTIDAFAMLRGVKTLCVGVSGGADSVCLLRVLLELKPLYGFTLQAVHVHHGLRQQEADRDAQFVETLCDALAVPCRVVRVDAAKTAADRGISVEEAGRLLRYQAFDETHCDAIAVAHTRSDAIETALFHLARGTTLRGAAGIPPVRGKVIRPLIHVTRNDVETYLRSIGASWVEDSTNQSDAFTRNRIRHTIVPAFQTVNPAFETTFARFLDTAKLQSDFLREQARNLLDTARTADGYDRKALLSAHPALRLAALHTLLQSNMEKPAETVHVELCDAALREQHPVQLGADLFFTVTAETVQLTRRQPQDAAFCAAFDPAGTATPRGMVRLVPADPSGRLIPLDKDKLKQPLLLRTRQPGDRFCDVRRHNTKTLKKLLNEAKIPPCQRGTLLILESGGAVAWVEGFGASRDFCADETAAVPCILEIQ